MTGRIVKATGGFYYVRPQGERMPDSGDRQKPDVIECRARGIFRRHGLSPYVGDIVDIVISEEDGSGTVSHIHPRKNETLRPPLANLDCMVMLLSVADPAPNYYTTDQLLAMLEHKGIPALIAVTKPDLEDAGEIVRIYEAAGYPVYVVNNRTGEGAAELAGALRGKLCAFSGNSGVGKSSLLNAIDPALALAVGDTSRKLGRGRHTTRHCEIFELGEGALVADTPGFSSVDVVMMSELRAEELADCFPEFGDYIGGCRFQDCRHLAELGCAVREAAEEGKIPKSRYRSYMALFGEIKDVKDWERR